MTIKKEPVDVPEFYSSIENLVNNYTRADLKQQICDRLSKELSCTIWDSIEEQVNTLDVVGSWTAFKVSTEVTYDCFDRSRVHIFAAAFLKSDEANALCLLGIFPQIRVLATCKMNTYITCNTDPCVMRLVQEYREWKKEQKKH